MISKFKIIGILFLLFFMMNAFAQEGKAQAFWIHEDQVKPSMRMDYEKASRELVSACKTNNVQNIQWAVASMDDGTYLAITPIEDLAEIQTMNFGDLREKLGDEKFTKMFDNFNKCYDKHGDYVSYLIPSLSYMPDGLRTDTPGQDYRVWHRMEVSAGNIQKIEPKLKQLKELFASKNSKIHYRVYRNGFGNLGDYFVAVISAKDALDYDTRMLENQELLGEEGQKLFGEVFEYVENYKVNRGGMRPELAYQPVSEKSNLSKD